MKANERLDRQVKHKTVTITGKHETKITFLGSSCSASVNPGDSVDSFSLCPEGEETVYAVQIYYTTMPRGKATYYQYTHFLLGISRGDDGSPQVELERAFVPHPNRLGQVVPDAGLRVRIGEEFFLAPLLVSSCDTEKKLAALRTQYRLVANKDANLLCRFIAGKADAEEVKAAADELVVQTVDVPALLAKLAEAEQRAETLETERLRLRDLLGTTREEFDLFRKIAPAQAANDLEEIHELRGKIEFIRMRVGAIIDGTDPHAEAGGFWDTAGRKVKRIRSFLAEVQEK